MTPRAQLIDILNTAIDAVRGDRAVAAALRRQPVAGPVSLIAIGKAACAMARGAETVLGERIRRALVITRHGYAETLSWPVLTAGHPVPDDASLAAGTALDEFIASLPAQETVLVLLSGGASALVESLPAGVTLDDLQRINTWLLGSGLDIRAMNAIRRQLSCLKGGRLAARLAPRTVRCLLISDVPQDDPRVIGSGPLLAGEPATLDHTSLPDFLRAALAHAPAMPEAGADCFRRVTHEIVARLADAKAAAVARASALGLKAIDERMFVDGPAEPAGSRLAATLLESPANTLHVWGGETTVILPSQPGRGGRCQQLALSAARSLVGRPGTWLLAATTDGSDGPGEAAGALVDGETLARAAVAGFNAGDCLARADAGSLLAATGDLLRTGPTGTNVMDVMLGLRLDPAS